MSVEPANDLAPQIETQRFSVVFDDVDYAGPTSSTPLLAEGMAPDTDPNVSLPTQLRSVAGSMNDDFLQAPGRDQPRDQGLRGPTTEDGSPQFPLKIPEEPGDYPHMNGPRNLKLHGHLPYQTRRIHIPLARHWIEHRPIARYAGDPLFKLSKACPYILVPQILAARLQLMVETPLVLPDEVKELAAARGLDVASLESYDIALLNILGALWDD